MSQLAEFNTSPHLAIGQEKIKELLLKAQSSGSNHYRLCLHQDTNSLIQEMIIVVLKGALFPVHKHPPGKSESIHLIDGELSTFLFDDDGTVIDIMHLSSNSKNPNRSLIQRINGDIWHLPLCTSEYAIYHEIYAGPYDKEQDVAIPPWSPQPQEPTALKQFYQALQDTYLENKNDET
ncbi:cupin fold metalloprotein, WbuC family [Pseudoalteromonas rubra]|uniref:Cupin fold metalloprotein, WbuC family n=1 Tax=Pseudoalteromonas rubra TaxID=43658 RepID=A0A5S3UYJ4_9GAMM|nr:WbuC family cupin fold metalloprotein [Pseudoalteromonas rubra]QPB82640.1 cupin fold metalloprotein, WbuC family [Pseudoalteromonas rubra]